MATPLAVNYISPKALGHWTLSGSELGLATVEW